jgi:ribosomal protein S16
VARRRRRPALPARRRVIETVGQYNAQTEPSTIVLKEDRIEEWLSKGAQPTAQVKRLIQAHAKAKAADVRGELAREAPHVRELLEYLARLLVEAPDEVQVEQFEEEDGTVVLELAVASEDYGRIIGRGGRTANALRTVIKAAAVKENRRVLVDIVD